MNIDRKQIMEAFLRLIDHISDKDYQMRVWVRGEGPECDDFDKTYEFYYELGDTIIEEYKLYDITEMQCEILIKFRSAFTAFDDAHSPELEEEFIDSPDWTTITKMAKEVLKVLNYKKPI